MNIFESNFELNTSSFFLLTFAYTLGRRKYSSSTNSNTWLVIKIMVHFILEKPKWLTCRNHEEISNSPNDFKNVATKFPQATNLASSSIDSENECTSTSGYMIRFLRKVKTPLEREWRRSWDDSVKTA
jgi:hypothetical protein